MKLQQPANGSPPNPGQECEIGLSRYLLTPSAPRGIPNRTGPSAEHLTFLIWRSMPLTSPCKIPASPRPVLGHIRTALIAPKLVVERARHGRGRAGGVLASFDKDEKRDNRGFRNGNVRRNECVGCARLSLRVVSHRILFRSLYPFFRSVGVSVVASPLVE